MKCAARSQYDTMECQNPASKDGGLCWIHYQLEDTETVCRCCEPDPAPSGECMHCRRLVLSTLDPEKLERWEEAFRDEFHGNPT